MARFYPNKPIKGNAVLYVLNAACNMKCRQCYLKDVDGKSRDVTTALSDVQELLSQGFEVIPIGSEVLLNPNFLNVYKLASRSYIRSNGTTIVKNPDLVQRIQDSGIDNIIFTLPVSPALDVTPQQTVEEAIALSLQAGLNVCGSAVICKGNYQEVERIAQYALNKGVNVLEFLNLIPTNPALADQTLNDREVRDFFQRLTRIKEEIPKEILYFTTNRNFGLDGRQQKEGPCPVGTRLSVIGLDNKIYPCVFLMREQDAIGEFACGKIKVYNSLQVQATRNCLARTILGGGAND